jgi:hypothetical protein
MAPLRANNIGRYTGRPLIIKKSIENGTGLKFYQLVNTCFKCGLTIFFGQFFESLSICEVWQEPQAPSQAGFRVFL